MFVPSQQDPAKIFFLNFHFSTMVWTKSYLQNSTAPGSNHHNNSKYKSKSCQLDEHNYMPHSRNAHFLSRKGVIYFVSNGTIRVIWCSPKLLRVETMTIAVCAHQVIWFLSGTDSKLKQTGEKKQPVTNIYKHQETNACNKASESSLN
jgi:hypothetical protein